MVNLFQTYSRMGRLIDNVYSTLVTLFPYTMYIVLYSFHARYTNYIDKEVKLITTKPSHIHIYFDLVSLLESLSSNVGWSMCCLYIMPFRVKKLQGAAT